MIKEEEDSQGSENEELKESDFMEVSTKDKKKYQPSLKS